MTDPANQPAGIELAHAAAMPAPQGGALPTGLEWAALERMANTLADSDVIPYRLKRKPADVAVVLLAAREYGIPPLMALSKLPVVNGTPAPMGELMVALILRAGHRIGAKFHNPDGTIYSSGPLTRDHYGEAVYRRSGWEEPETLRFSIGEAIQAGLVTLTHEGYPRARDSKDQPTPWEQYTPNMARWRAVANAARLAFADVLMGLSYLPEELGAIVDADGAPIVAGEVVASRRADGRSLEQRTAQDAADRLAEQPWPVAVIDQVATHAHNNGYAGETVTYRGETMTLVAALTAARAESENMVTAEVVTEPAQPAQEDARADQAEPAQEDARDARAEEALAQTLGAQPIAEEPAQTAPAAQPPAAAAAAPAPAARNDVLLGHVQSELVYQAEILGIGLQEYVRGARLLQDPADMSTLIISRATPFLAQQRDRVITALRQQGRSTEAANLEQVKASPFIMVADLTRPRADTDEPIPVTGG